MLQKEAIEAWKAGGAQVPNVLVIGEGKGGNIPFIYNLDTTLPQPGAAPKRPA